MGPRFLYLHGFGSGPASKKGVALEERFAERGVRLELLDLRVPSFERLRLSTIVRTVKAAIGGSDERVVLLGSSLGGLAAARVAEEDPRVCALVLLAPAFRMAERWRARLGENGVDAWQKSGWLTVYDHAAARTGRVDFAFLLDAAEVDAHGGGWPDVRVPVLVLHGRRDETVEIDCSREWVAGKRHVQLVELDDVHELIAELPRVIAEIEGFLTPFLGAPAGR